MPLDGSFLICLEKLCQRGSMDLSRLMDVRGKVLSRPSEKRKLHASYMIVKLSTAITPANS